MTIEGFTQAFADFGGWMYGIILLGCVLLFLLIRQFMKIDETDTTWLLWGIFVSLLTFGPLGSIIEIIKAFTALEFIAPDNRLHELFKQAGAAMHPTVFAYTLAAVATIPLGFITQKIKARRQERADPNGLGKKGAGLLWLLLPLTVLLIPLGVLLASFDDGSVIRRIVEPFAVGGPFMALITLPFVAFCALFVFQLVKRRTHDITWLLWDLFLLISVLGIMGIGVGLIQAGADVAIRTDTLLSQAIAPGIAVVLNTFSLAVICCFSASIPLGILAHFIKRSA